jgi:Tol biopolymer transport system component
MSPERFEEVEELYHGARELEPSQRSAFLAGACGADEELRRQVESLLAQDPREGMLDRPLAGLLEDATVTTLDAGVLLGPYRIEAPIGAGGMGEVYRAIDTRLGRAVALKTSREKFSGRFEREARAIAALNHPHICTLYDVGPNHLVMELVEGETLAARLKRGKLSIHLALQYGSQIADALAAAHAKGIIHRDLKPGNIMLTKNGVKVLDFGLAKSLEDGTLTGANAVMGTPAYMAPEQREGKECDARTDIYALGLVLREMAADPPPHLARVIDRCLAAEPENRWHSAKDLQFELDGPLAMPSPATRSPAPLGWIAAAGVLAIGLAILAFLHFRQTPPPDRVLRLDISPPEGGRFVGLGLAAGGAALSPDGRMVAFVAAINGKTGLWVRAFDDRTARLLPGTEGAGDPFWSPDSKSIAFWAASRLQRIELAGGPPVTIGAGDATPGAAWSANGEIVFGSSAGGLLRVPASGGTPVPLTRLDVSRGETFHWFPQILPRSRLLYWALADKPENTGLYVAPFAKPAERVLLLRTETAAIFAPGGDGKDYLLWLRGGTLLAQELDSGALKLRGEPRAIAGPIPSTGTMGAIPISASAGGQLLYNTAGSTSQLTWFDRTGRRLAAMGEEYVYSNSFRLAPDGRRVAATRDRPGGNDLWLLDPERGSASRFTSASASNIYPVWSPDGRMIVFTTTAQRLFRKDAGGSSEEQRIIEGLNPQYANDWSRDGRILIYYEKSPGTQRDLWTLSLTPEGKVPEDAKPTPYLRTKFNEYNARFSPEPSPRWVAYQSDETGRYEIYIQGFPEPRAKFQVSTGGGQYSEWGADGRELFYVDTDNKLMAVDLTITADAVRPATTRTLFTLPIIDNGWPPYDTIDGQRFLVRAVPQQAAPPLTVIVNWPALLKRGSAAP